MKRISIILLSLTLLLSACTKPPPEETGEPEALQTTQPPTASPSLKPTDAPETNSPTPETAYYHPLNGSALEEEFGDKRPYAVMINNIVPALPACGVTTADIVYEVLAEGGVTRLMVIFSDITDVPALGSIRSVRPYYIEISRAYDALLLHAGGSEQAYYDIPNKGVDNLDGVRGPYGDGTLFYRDQTRLYSGYAWEHTLFTTSELIAQYAPLFNYRMEHEEEIDYGLRFTDDATPKDGEDAKNIRLVFAGYKSSDLNYFEEDGVYYMTQYGLKFIDGNTQEAIGFSNVIALFANTVNTGDEYAHIDVSLNGSGEGYFAHGGKLIPIKWTRDGDGETFTYTTEDGSPLEVGVGRTFVGIIPTPDKVNCTYN